ncbi:hypothetical protein CEXT_624061 [Caerostris extrusa]|uniref:Uncharacterized protein n=1 Tax=Caerostris extrusa TaxID=172846 RepID=A0AAV4MZD9_CAEEX|nr:hypothetical protein CEXT_624061 [Caerostris extrusa]
MPHPKEAVKAKAEASPLQFASEIQISVNHNLITKKKNSVREREFTPLVKGISTPTPETPNPVREKETPLTLEGPYRLSTVVSIDRTHPSEATSYLSLKPNKALRRVRESLLPQSGLHLRHCRQQSGTPNGNPWRKCASSGDEFRQDAHKSINY